MGMWVAISRDTRPSLPLRLGEYMQHTCCQGRSEHDLQPAVDTVHPWPYHIGHVAAANRLWLHPSAHNAWSQWYRQVGGHLLFQLPVAPEHEGAESTGPQDIAGLTPGPGQRDPSDSPGCVSFGGK